MKASKVLLTVVCCCSLLLSMTYNANADNEGLAVPSSKRPKVGIVLAGGGAKGSAHIGVLKYLEEVGIPVDFVAGTSMGSIIGGLYSLGYTAVEMDELISNMDWSIYMSDKVDRSMMSYREKVDRGQYLITVPFSTGNFSKTMSDMNSERQNAEERNLSFISSLPSGFISGQNILNLFNNLSVGYQDSINFDNLPIPYACVATNVLNGEPEVLRSGQLPLAMRASMAIPGVFAPVNYYGKILVDGGMRNNFPVDVCRAMGADIIIGVEVNEGMKTDMNKLKSLPELLSQLMSIVTSSELTENRKLCDIYIHPSVKGFGTMSFDKASIDTLIQRGYDEATKYKDELYALKGRLNSYGDMGKRISLPPASNILEDTIMISSIEVRGISPSDGPWLLKRTTLLDDGQVSGTEIDRAIAVMYGMNAFSSITYQLVGDGEPYILVLNFKVDQPHRFGLGFRFDSEETAAILLSVGLNTQKLNGPKLDLTGRLSYNPWAKATASISFKGLPLVSLSYNFRKSGFDLYDDEMADMNILLHKHSFEFSISERYSRFFHFSAGVKQEQFRMKHLLKTEGMNDAYKPLNITSSVGNYLFAFANLQFDNRNRAFLSKRGMRAECFASWMSGVFSTNQFSNVGILLLDYMANVSVSDKITFIPQIYSRVLVGPVIPTPYRNLMGGSYPGRYFTQQLPFIGIHRPELLRNSVAIGRLDVRGQIAKKQYIAAIANYARESDEIQDIISQGRGMWGFGLEYTYDAIVGPISLNLHWSDLTNKVGLYFNFGYYF